MRSGRCWSRCCPAGRSQAARRSGRNGSSLTGSGGECGPGRRGGTCRRPTGPADGLRSVPPLAAERDLAEDPGRPAGPRRCGRADHLGRVGGLHGGAGAPARGRGTQARESAGRAARRARGRAGRSRAGPVPRRADHQGAPGLRAGPEAALRGHHRRAARRQPAVPGRAGAHPGPPARPGAARAPARTGCWQTRPTGPAPTALTCAGAGSSAPFRRRPTRSATARPGAAPAAARPRSTPKTTRPAMPWNAALTGSSATAPSPPATTSSPSATRPPSASPRSTNGSYPLMKHALACPAFRTPGSANG